MPRLIQDQAGSWNLRKSRDPKKVAKEVHRLLKQEKLHWLAVQEAHQYIKALQKELGDDYKVITGRGSKSRRDNAIIVRKDVWTRWKRVHSLGGIGWERAPHNRRFGLHQPRHMTTVRLHRRGGYRVGSVHLAPTPNFSRLPLRGKSHEASVRIIARMARRWNRRLAKWVFVGDWNVRPGDSRVNELRRLGKILGHGIDWILRSRGLNITQQREIKFGNSDHDPILFTVTRRVG